MDTESEILLPGPPWHPRLDEDGKLVKLAKPSTPTAQSTWMAADALAVVIPEGPMPASLHGLAFAPWRDAPRDDKGWEILAEKARVDEPAFALSTGKKAAAGVVVLEPDGRAWAVAPSNAFGNYPATFPKGTRDKGMSLKATALREAFEEAGLQVELTGFLLDVTRSTSDTRYYLARRVGGHPAKMGWESQAVMLVPIDLLKSVLTNPNDAPIMEALKHSACNQRG